MGIDGLAQLVVALVGFRSRELDVEPHLGEAGAHGLVGAEQSRCIQIGLGPDDDLVEGNAELLRVEAVDDDLASGQRAEYSTGLVPVSSPASAAGSSTMKECLPARTVVATEPAPAPSTV